MSRVETTRLSAQHPEQFRSNVEDAARVLRPNASFPPNPELPVITSQSDIAIIGAGFSGLASAVMCRRKLHTDNFVVFEKHANWGGTWWANTYPGCASDIPALWYSLHSDLNGNWSDLRPPQYEMEEYILALVDKYRLREKCKFETAVTQAVYDAARGVWRIDAVGVASGQRFEHTARVVMQCQGGVVYPHPVEFPGLRDRFRGAVMHSALWDHGVDFRDKDVVVVGNGCSAAQVVPALMDDLHVRSVTQVFRSKHWIMPPLPRVLYTAYRALCGFRLGLVAIRWFVIIAAEMRYPLYQGNSVLALAVRFLNTVMATWYIRLVAPKEYHDLLLPKYKLGCKRLIFDYKYVPSLKNPKLDLTDSPIAEVTEHHVVLQNGRRIKADVIVACTGYNITRSFFGIKIVGRNNTNVGAMWAAEGVSAYKTVLVRDCPNYFFIGGPNSATGHFSVVSAIENAVAFSARYIPGVLSGQYKSVAVSTDAYNRWFTEVQARLKKAVFGSEFGGCTSWYTDNGINATAYPYSQLHYWLSSRYSSSKELEFEKDGKKRE